MLTSISILALASALFYCLSMYAMKEMAIAPSVGMALVIVVAMVIAALFEVFALKQERLGLIYVGILGAEVVIIGSLSLFYFDESYSMREVSGIALVLVGTAIAWA